MLPYPDQAMKPGRTSMSVTDVRRETDTSSYDPGLVNGIEAEASADALALGFGVANMLLRNRRLFVAIPTILVVAVICIVLALPRKYTTVVAFAPAASSVDLSQFSNLASQFGLALPGDDPTQSPLFYADLIQTPSFLRQLAETKTSFADGHVLRSGNLVQLYGIADRTPGETLDDAIRLLQQTIVSVDVDPQTNIVTVTIRSKWRGYSETLGHRILDLVNEFNIRARQTQAQAERNFVKQRVDSAAAELANAEGALESFLKSNRLFESDPQLVLHHDRLERAVNLQQQLYITLQQAYEQARIAAVRNTPSITLIQAPTPALVPDRRGLLLKSIVSAISGLMLATLLALIADYVRDSRASTGSLVREFDKLIDASRRDLHTLLSLGRSSR